MKKFHTNSLKALTFSASALAFVLAGPLAAQDKPESDDEQEEEEQVDVGSEGTTAESEARITVTGSRIVRDTYSSISPLQVISTQNQQALGAFDPAQILQTAETAAGIQIDATFQGFVLDNGPGSQTINLRGLDPSRTLVLVNGRRLSPAGVEGAPTSPSINLIPASLVDRYEILTDGASTVYGSDAIAGVVNAVLRKDFDGLELQVLGDYNQQGAGNDYTISGAWGFNTDRAVFGIGAEYRFVEEVKAADRSFLRGCTTNLEENAAGEIFRLGVADNAVVQDRTPGVSVSESECIVSGISGRIFQPYARFGSVYFPGNGNIANFPVDPITGNTFNFGESTDAFGVDLDVNGDGIRDVDFQNVNVNASEAELDRTIIPKQQYTNVFAYGEYTFPGEANITPFFEAQYSRSDINNSGAGNPQIFPSVPADNPFNPCNFTVNPDGVDCRSVDNALLGLTNGVRPALSTGFNLPTIPIAAIEGDRNNFDVLQEQYRGVLGVRGDLPFIGSTWTFELAGSYSRSVGKSSRLGIREDRLALALGLDPTADYDGDGVVDNDGDGIADDYNEDIDIFSGDPRFIGVCNAAGVANPELLPADVAPGCVPVNLFAPSVLTGAVGDFATQAERDYVFDSRDFDTVYEQTLLNGYVTGDLFELPAGPVGVVVGGEWREDAIDSQPDFTASNGLFFGFFADGGATGSAWIREAFGEISLPLIAGETLVEELTVNLAGRITDQEFYGTNTTYSLQGGWRPVAPLLLRMTYGTSFRAPNLRENFLRGQSGFTSIFDPCAVPDEAFVNGAYDASLDQREDFVLRNCIREGRDPTSVGIDAEGLNTQQVVSGEVTQGGSLDIDPETSRSLTAGFSFEESFASGFDLALSANYYDILLEDSIIEPSAAFIVGDCYGRDDETRSEFCDRIEINSASDRQLISGVQAGFLNRDKETVRGLDLNATMAMPVTLGGEAFDIGLNMIANHLIERRNLQITETGDVLEQDLKGERGFPDWTGRLIGSVRWQDFIVRYEVRYLDEMNADFREIEIEEDVFAERPFGDAFGNVAPGSDPAFTSAFSPTCLGAGGPNGNVEGDGNFCRPIGTTPEYFIHTASIDYNTSNLRIVLGVRNLFDTDPPLVSPSSGGFQISNVPLGLGYDLNGREFFGQVQVRF